MLIYWLVIIFVIFVIFGLFLLVPDANKKLNIFIWSIPVLPVFGQVIQRQLALSFAYVVFQIIIGLSITTLLFVLGKKITCPRYMKIIIVFWILANLFSVVLSVNPHESFILFIIAIVFPVVLYLSVYNIVNNHSKLEKLVYAFMIAGLAHILISYLIILTFSIERGLGSVHDINLISTSYVGNGFIANFLLVATFFLFYFNRGQQVTRQVIVYSILVLFIAETFMTASRTTFVLIPFILLVYFFTPATHSRMKLVIIIMTLVIGTWFALSDPGGTFTMARARLVGYGQDINIVNIIGAAEDDSRLDIWVNSFNIGKERNLITGTGLGQLAKLDQKYTFGDAHSLWLNVLVQQGILSFIVFVILLISFYINNLKWRLKYGDWNNIMLGSFWALTVFCVYGTITGASLFNLGGYIGAIPSFYLFFHLATQDVLIKLNKERFQIVR